MNVENIDYKLAKPLIKTAIEEWDVPTAGMILVTTDSGERLLFSTSEWGQCWLLPKLENIK